MKQIAAVPGQGSARKESNGCNFVAKLIARRRKSLTAQQKECSEGRSRRGVLVCVTVHWLKGIWKEFCLQNFSVKFGFSYRKGLF